MPKQLRAATPIDKKHAANDNKSWDKNHAAHDKKHAARDKKHASAKTPIKINKNGVHAFCQALVILS
jgi:hypothetical protein